MATNLKPTLCLLIISFAYGLIHVDVVDVKDQFAQSIERTKITPKPGRHVCTTESIISRPVPVIQTYKKPVYTSRPRDCPNIATCPQYDVKYIPANRTVYQLQRYSKFERSCCPGWTKSGKREKGCMGAICTQGCGDFGVCVKPDTCLCRTGFAGDMCDTDIDECKGRNHDCSQICKNTAGSYMCACQEGFVLAADGRTCTFCFTCQKEYMNMMGMITSLQHDLLAVRTHKQMQKKDDLGNLTREIELLKREVLHLKHKNAEVETMHDNSTQLLVQLRHDVTVLNKQKQDLKEVIDILEHNQSSIIQDIEVLKLAPTIPPTPQTASRTTPRTTSTTPTTPSTTTTSTTTTTATTSRTTSDSFMSSTGGDSFGIQFDPSMMMMSLSNQIGQLEEKLDLCQCNGRG